MSILSLVKGTYEIYRYLGLKGVLAAVKVKVFHRPARVKVNDSLFEIMDVSGYKALVLSKRLGLKLLSINHKTGEVMVEWLGYRLLLPNWRDLNSLSQVEKDYEQIEVKGMKVLDIGGYIGDTALLFKRVLNM